MWENKEENVQSGDRRQSMKGREEEDLLMFCQEKIPNLRVGYTQCFKKISYLKNKDSHLQI